MLVKKATFGDGIAFTHPELDMEHRIVLAECGPLVFGSVYVPNGGKDYKAKLRFPTSSSGGRAITDRSSRT